MNEKEIKKYKDFVDEKIIKIHKCDDIIKKKDIAILMVEFSEVQKNYWVMSIINRAKKNDVTEGEADFIGEVLWGTMLRIKFCTFCGEKLNT